MLQITPQMRILLSIKPADFRKGIDGLAGICRNELHEDPFTGTVFIFRNRARTALKILVYDGQGMWLCNKRLSEGRFKWWPQDITREGKIQSLLAYELQVLLWNGDPTASNIQEQWREIKTTIEA